MVVYVKAKGGPGCKMAMARMIEEMEVRLGILVRDAMVMF